MNIELWMLNKPMKPLAVSHHPLPTNHLSAPRPTAGWCPVAAKLFSITYSL